MDAIPVKEPLRHDWEREKTRILANNTAQGVHKHLRNLESNRSHVLPRWIWELLQNARDVADKNASLVASVEVRDGELTFRHNGRGFEPEEITHLVYYGSTKLELGDPIGQFGSGFLTTHLLSPIIEVAGQLTDGQQFAFRLDRSGDSVLELQRCMDASFEAFTSSLAPAAVGVDSEAATTFRYSIDERASKAVRQGERALAVAGPYVTAFNRVFRRIQFQTPESGMILKLSSRSDLGEHIEKVEVDVSAQHSKPRARRSLLIAELDEVAVAVPVVRRGEDIILEAPRSVPRLFLGFPLIGTEDFSFPAVVHSLRFSPTEERDGVYLGRSDDQVNIENQAVLKHACRLILLVAEFAAELGWRRIHVLATVPPIRKHRWLDEVWVRDCLRRHLVDPLRGKALVLTESDGAVAPIDSSLPTAASPDAVDRLWSLASALTALKETLPRQSEAQGWCHAALKWADLYGCALGELEETMDGRDLARRAESAGSIETLQAQLGDEDATSWLNDLHGFLSENDFDDALRGLRIVPDQNGQFSNLQELHRDRAIPSELKEIAQLVDWDLRAELRDVHFETLAEEPGAGDLDSEAIIPKLIERLRKRVEKPPIDDDSKVASVKLFGWIAEHGQWRHLEGFPAFSDEGTSSTTIRLLFREDKDPERPLAPVRTWPEPLRQYADLFPKRRTLAEEFAVELDRPALWSSLDQRGFVRKSVLYTQEESVDVFFPDDHQLEGEYDIDEHELDECVEVTDIAFLTTRDIGVLSRVRQSRKQALLFWDFLTRWLAVEDAKGLEAQESLCHCGFSDRSSHRYFSAAWLDPVARKQWVPLGHRRTDRASAQSLAILLRESDWPLELLQTSPPVIALLKVLRVGVPALIMELFTTDEEEREALDETLAQLLTSVGSKWDRLQMLAEEIQEDGELFVHLEKRRQRRRIVRENQQLGELVEKLVRESLEGEGFDVQRTGVGSDFAIQPLSINEDEQIQLELTGRGRTWLVEIKSAREDSVRMTSVQARTSVEYHSDYLLCVVPISPGAEGPDKQAVRRRMCFVDGIGARLAGICADLEKFESFRERVTVEDAEGLRLELDSGSPRIRVESTVWEAGFGLEELLSRLTKTDDDAEGAVGY